MIHISLSNKWKSVTQFCLRTAEILLVCMHGAQIKCKSWQCRRRVTREHVMREHEKGHERACDGF